jgi:nitrile hydratase
LGGVPGYGKVRPEAEEPAFHADWERRVLAVTLAMAVPGDWNIDMSRAARESLPEYLSKSYYEIWLAGLEQLMAERGLVGTDEIAAGRVLHPPKAIEKKLLPGDVAPMLFLGKPTWREAKTAARFAVGARVRALSFDSPTHTRLPRYVRGHTGVAERVHGCHVFPDRNALGLGEDPQWLYTVRFDGRELWGAGTDARVQVSVDAWESYLEPA